MTETMRAVVLDEPGPATNLHVRRVPLPRPAPGWVRIRVKAFGLNRSEVMTRVGHSGAAVIYPRILGIEAVGVVDLDLTGTFREGQQVATLMGDMGRAFDGGYAEFTCVPVAQVIPFSSDLDWSLIGAVPEMLQTAHGSLTVGLDARPGQTLLVRGGTSSVGMATAVLAKRLGLTVLSTTRSPAKAEALTAIGVDHVIVDDGDIAARVRAIVPGGVDAALELVGTPTLHDTLRATRVHGTVCFTGMLSEQWTVTDFYPIDYLPAGVRLTAYTGGAADLLPEVLQTFLDEAAAGHVTIPLDRTFPLARTPEAHLYLESGQTRGKVVVLP
ncbi:NADPH:quinone reductase [Serinibacter arcticus]|uniref:NADPH:quinone reductase n=1 Tax=Serinibacter arcticus TaxID=1655435 RepID=A0A2U1ZX60_9MICO|nr:zinc-binding alcohol dehydrogenase family protein [Serinibacter arcticus]PWD51561.1 NADPH:quinone reductase [Serinibacter arcticus]